jgi:DNA-binding NarL/FixJ family response regulator
LARSISHLGCSRSCISSPERITARVSARAGFAARSGGGKPWGSHEAKEYAARYLDQQHWRRDPAIVEAQERAKRERPALIRVDIAGLDPDLRAAMFPHVSDRIVICGQRSGTAIGLSIIRSNPHEPFPEDAVARLNEVTDLLVCVIAKHADVIVNRPDLALALASLRDIEQCATSQTSLPRREIEVCARILYGMSSIGIALDLGIGEESVKTYRKRIYERLHIGSERSS